MFKCIVAFNFLSIYTILCVYLCVFNHLIIMLHFVLLAMETLKADRFWTALRADLIKLKCPYFHYKYTHIQLFLGNGCQKETQNQN